MSDSCVEEAPIEPTSFDLIVIGTGLPQSVIAAAASAAGKAVLHLDPNDFYGSHFTSRNLNELTSFLNSHTTPPSTTTNTTSTSSSHDYTALDLEPRSLYSNIQTANYAPEILAQHSTKINVDLGGPRVLFCADKAVELIVKSGVESYLEFKSIDVSFIWDGTQGLWNVPDSRAAIFKDKSLSLIEKNQLMRFFKLVQQHLEASDGEGTENSGSSKISEEDLESPFVDFLKRMRLPPKIKVYFVPMLFFHQNVYVPASNRFYLQHAQNLCNFLPYRIILYAIAMVDYDQDNFEVCKNILKTRDGIERLALYHKSVGRFPNAPGAFLYPAFGHRELSESFCRRAAVKGCICALRRPVTALLMEKVSGQYKGVRLASGQDLFSDQLVLDPTFTVPFPPASSPPDLQQSLKDDKQKVARGICITTSSLKPDISNLLLVYPPRSLYPEQDTSVRAIQIGDKVGVCPLGMFMLYFSALCDDAEQGKRLLHSAMNALLTLPVSENPESGSTAQSEDAEVKPTLLWSMLYIQEQTMGQYEYPISTPMPDGNLNYNALLNATVELFQKMYPNEEFFPKTPSSPENSEDDTEFSLDN